MTDMSGGLLSIWRAARDADWAEVLQLLAEVDFSNGLTLWGSPLLEMMVELDPPLTVVESFLQHGYPPNGGGGSRCLLDLYLDRMSTSAGAKDSFESLLQYGADPNSIALGGRTLLQAAIASNRVEATKLLLAFGADPLSKSVHGDESESAVEVAGRLLNESASLVLRHTESANREN